MDRSRQSRSASLVSREAGSVLRALSLAHAGETAHLLVIRGAEGWSDPLSTKTMHTSNSKECPTNSFQKCNLLLTTAIRVHNFQSQMIRRDLRGRVSRTPPQPESRSPSPGLGRNDLNPGVPARTGFSRGTIITVFRAHLPTRH